MRYVIIVLQFLCIFLIAGCGQLTKSDTRQDTNNATGVDNSYVPIIERIITTPTNLNGTAPYAINFSADFQDLDSQTWNYYWEFGDGYTSKEESPTHTFAYQGTFYVSVTITDEKGNTDRHTHYTPVNCLSGNRRPAITSCSSSLVTAAVGTEINLQAQATDPDGDPLSYTWTIAEYESKQGKNISQTFTRAGLTPIRCTVMDQYGAWATYDLIVAIGTNENIPPIIDTFMLSPETGEPPCMITMQAHAKDLDGSIATYIWNFGDGLSASGASVSHEYKIKGDYTISLTVTDDLGKSTSISQPLSLGSGWSE